MMNIFEYVLAILADSTGSRGIVIDVDQARIEDRLDHQTGQQRVGEAALDDRLTRIDRFPRFGILRRGLLQRLVHLVLERRLLVELGFADHGTCQRTALQQLILGLVEVAILRRLYRHQVVDIHHVQRIAFDLQRAGRAVLLRHEQRDGQRQQQCRQCDRDNQPTLRYQGAPVIEQPHIGKFEMPMTLRRRGTIVGIHAHR